MNEHAKKKFQGSKQSQTEMNDSMENENNDMTKLQDDSVNKSEEPTETDKESDVADTVANEKNDHSWEEKYVALNDSYLRLVAEFDNFRKRTIREKADLIKSGSSSAMENLLPVIDDFERAMNVLQSTDDITSAVEGVSLIYEKFMNYLSQQGVKAIEAIDQPFNTDYFEAIATFPVPENDRKGLVIDCVQTGYKIYNKVLRHAKVVVGE